MNEWEFIADVAKWIAEILLLNENLPFAEAKCEQTGRGSRQRRDLTLLDDNRQVCLTGEVKLPYQRDGGTPLNTKVVKDARNKARKAKSPYFFTWNVNEFVLWETPSGDIPWTQDKYRSWQVTSVHRENQFQLRTVTDEIHQWLAGFLYEFARIIRGKSAVGRKSPDERFVEALEFSLEMPILLNLDEVAEQYKKSRCRGRLDKWMREEQGWTIYDDPQGIQENLERAVKFSCYTLVNKLVFYEALLKRHAKKLSKLNVPAYVDTADGLRTHLERYFAQAKEKTGDYETVFGEEHTGIGNLIPFYSDAAAAHWRTLINQIHEFDFSKLDYEVIGNIFERLISPEERHKYGQFYTRVEVVDLINSFCIRRGDEKVMDPACGGGTFLVRAYARKREYAPERHHDQHLADLFGVDVSHFATHLTTINLATRDLIDEENYPQIERKDFFNIRSTAPFMRLPLPASETARYRDVTIPPLDAVVGNPPYVRQEDIPRSAKKKEPALGTKEYYQSLIQDEAEIRLSGRSDIHCYFWPHAATFLKDRGHLALITSSQWLDVEYGFKLQEWILKNFEILAIFESLAEPWFVGARVATTVTVMRRQKDEAARMNNQIRFVQLRRPLREVVSHNGSTLDAMRAADEFRDEVLYLQQNTVNQRYRARMVRQGDLWDEGVRLGVMLGKSQRPEDHDPKTQVGDYYGGKWGVHLRAPDIWFKLLDEFSKNLNPLGETAEVRFGVKSGKDDFFFPKDCSDQCLRDSIGEREFRDDYHGVSRRELISGKIRLLQCGEKLSEIRPLEAEYLEPEIHSLMDIDQFVVESGSCPRSIVLIPHKKSNLKDKYAKRYVAWGEKCDYHKAETCASRVSEDHEWYDLTRFRRPSIILPKIQQYRLLAFLNPDNLYQASSLLGIYGVPIKDVDILCAILNSSFAVLSRLIYARILGNEGNIQLDVYSAKMMMVPSTYSGTKTAREKAVQAFEQMKRRKALQFLSEQRLRRMSYTQQGKSDKLKELSDECELDMEDRWQLDDAVLQMIGVKPKNKRNELLRQLYGHLRRFFESTRRKEEQAIENKKRAKRRGKMLPADIAAQIYEDVKKNHPLFLRRYDPDFLDLDKPFDTYDLPAQGEPVKVCNLLDANGVDFKKGKRTIAPVKTRNSTQDALIVAVVNAGVRGLVAIPYEESECRGTLEKFEKFVSKRDAHVRELIENRTADEELQEKVYDALVPMLV